MEINYNNLIDYHCKNNHYYSLDLSKTIISKTHINNIAIQAFKNQQIDI
jgi:hypothetical protein